MKARERLLEIVVDIGNGPDDGALVDINAEDAAALRELDGLCQELTQWAKAYIEPFTDEHLENHPLTYLIKRAAQAGYGEK